MKYRAVQHARNSLYFVVPPLLVLIMGIRGISAVPLWVDELYTWKSVSGGIGETLGEGQYLPYYTFEWLSTGGGACLTESCLRFPSLAAMAIAASVLAITGGLLFGRRAALATGVLFAMTPSVQHWGQDARPYALATLLVSLSALMFVLATRHGSWWLWLCFASFVALSTAVLPMTTGQLCAFAVIALWTPRSKGTVQSFFVTTMALLPVLYLIVKPSLGLAASPAFHEADHFAPSANDAFTLLSWPTTGGFFTSVSAGAFAGLLLLLALLNPKGRLWYLAGLIGVATLWLSSFIGPSFWLGRFSVPFLCFEVIGAGAIFATFSTKKSIAVFLTAGLIMIPAYTENLLPWSRGLDWRSAMRTIDANWNPGDTLVFDPQMLPSAGWAVEYYGRQHNYQLNSKSANHFWVIDGWLNCAGSTDWDLGLGHSLTLCTSSPKSH